MVFNRIGKYALQNGSFPLSPRLGVKEKNILKRNHHSLSPPRNQGAILQVGWRLVKIKVFRPTKGTSPKTSKSTDRRRLPFLGAQGMMGCFSCCPGRCLFRKTKSHEIYPTTEARDFVSAPPPKKGDPTEVNI